MDFQREFEEAVTKNKVDFAVRGMLSADDKLFPLGTDTKVLSTVFELFTRPLIREIAEAHDYEVEEAKQTIYPDFTLLKSPDDKRKIAIDVKTTYRRPLIVFTLGSYTSFLRNNTKNILYPYDQYAQHWIIGFVYTRSTSQTGIYSLEDKDKVVAPYSNVEWFVQEKYRISGESPGSGNTTNIGSIRTEDIEAFKQGLGPFAKLGEEVFRDYWAHYGESHGGGKITTLKQFEAWKRSATSR